ncbi:MAG: hypothetical protein GC192_21370 [Bacteroidetes bacterium]|nr:hypothetical protein [Bacteroidota bacterium]
MTGYTYGYSPYTGQDGEEIPAFEVFNEEGVKVADTNENLPSKEQEYTAILFSAAPTLLEVLEKAKDCFGQHNLLSTATDEERRQAIGRFSEWWNSMAVPAISEVKNGKW